MIVAGFGFRGGATVASLRDAYHLVGRPAEAVAAPADKVAADCFTEFADHLGLPVIAVPAEALRAAETLTHAPRVEAARGTGSVAEAAALVAVGPGGRLLGPRVISADRMATCALAQRRNP